MPRLVRFLRWKLWFSLPAILVLVLVGVRMLRSDALSNETDSYWGLFVLAISQPYFRLGDNDISPLFLVEVAAFIVLLFVATSRVDLILRDRILTKTAMDEGQRYAVARFGSYIVFGLGLAVGLQSIGLNLSTLTVFGGALGIGIGFGLQNLTKDFVSGLILLAERPVKVGDRVEVGTLAGDVVRIGARATWVRTNDNLVIVIPNSEFTEERVTNWTAHDRVVRFAVPLRVALDSDPEIVRSVLLEVASHDPDVMKIPAPDVVLTGFGENSIEFELRVWTQTKVQTPKVLRSAIYFAAFKAFQQAGIQIPIPQRDLHLRSGSLPVPPSS